MGYDRKTIKWSTNWMGSVSLPIPIRTPYPVEMIGYSTPGRGEIHFQSLALAGRTQVGSAF